MFALRIKSTPLTSFAHVFMLYTDCAPTWLGANWILYMKMLSLWVPFRQHKQTPPSPKSDTKMTSFHCV